MYIERERYRERERDCVEVRCSATCLACCASHLVHGIRCLGTLLLHNLAQDKGGPSKGGFLNNMSFSYTDMYLCNEINGMCI